jgi:hypothetical protein
MKNKEFRLFIYNNKITAISQQHIYKNSLWLIQKSDDELIQIVKDINNFFKEKVMDKILIQEYVMDIAFVNDHYYFIETNSFGKEYASGSALFNWLIDDNVLHNPEFINFRITF